MRRWSSSPPTARSRSRSKQSSAAPAISSPSRGATSGWQRRCAARRHCAEASWKRAWSAAARRSWPRRRNAAARRIPGDGAGPHADRAGGTDRCQCADPRRERHRQGNRRPRNPPPVAPRRPADRLDRPWRDRRKPVRVRTVRSRQGRLHRRLRRTDRAAQGGRPQHLVPRRNRQFAAAPSAQIADRAGAAAGGAGRREPAGADRRAGRRCDQLPADQLADETRFRQDLLFRLNTIEIQLAAAARAARGHPAAARTLSGNVRAQV